MEKEGKYTQPNLPGRSIYIQFPEFEDAISGFSNNSSFSYMFYTEFSTLQIDVNLIIQNNPDNLWHIHQIVCNIIIFLAIIFRNCYLFSMHFE